MSFGDQIKQELLSKNIKEAHCRKAFLAGLIRGSGTLFERDEEVCLSFVLPTEELLNTVSIYLKSLFNYDVREVSFFKDKKTNKDKFELVISGELGLKILLELDIFIEDQGDYIVNFDFYGKLTKKECCLKSFLKGLFITSGVCIVPDEKGKGKNKKYHLEIAFSHYEPAMATNGKLIEKGIFGKVTNRRSKYFLYIKSVESIKDFIAYLSANVSVLKLTDLIINRELINDTNRRMNCDLGNVNKQINASQKQLEAIEIIENKMGLDELKENEKIVCLARKEYPEDTLNELAERLNLSKSCLNHRLRKIIEIANELKGV